MGRLLNGEGMPLDEIFSNREMGKIRFFKWLNEKRPEDHTVTPEDVKDWRLFRRKERIRLLTKK